MSTLQVLIISVYRPFKTPTMSDYPMSIYELLISMYIVLISSFIWKVEYSYLLIVITIISCDFTKLLAY